MRVGNMFLSIKLKKYCFVSFITHLIGFYTFKNYIEYRYRQNYVWRIHNTPTK